MTTSTWLKRVLSASLSALLMVPVVAPSANAATSYLAHQFNMAGAVMNGVNSGHFLEPGFYIWQQAVVPHPDVTIVTVNEICFRQFDPLSSDMAANGYIGFFKTSHPSATNCGASGQDRRFGNAVFMKGTPTWQYGYQYYWQESPTVTEKRNFICGGTSHSGEPLVACSTHLLHSNDSIALNQSFEAILVIENVTGGAWKVVGGDWNLNPLQVEHWWEYYAEGDGGPGSFVNVTTSSEKIDYLWQDYAHGFTLPPAGRVTAVYNGINLSDHKHYRGTLWH